MRAGLRPACLGAWGAPPLRVFKAGLRAPRLRTKQSVQFRCSCCFLRKIEGMKEKRATGLSSPVLRRRRFLRPCLFLPRLQGPLASSLALRALCWVPFCPQGSPTQVLFTQPRTLGTVDHHSKYWKGGDISQEQSREEKQGRGAPEGRETGCVWR